MAQDRLQFNNMAGFETQAAPAVKFQGVSSFGSADPQFQNFIQNASPTVLTFDEKNPAPPLHPLLEDFSNLFDTGFKDTISKNPKMQASLFDIDNMVKGNAGIFRKQEDGVQHFGLDYDGKPLYAAPDYLSPDVANNFDAGGTQLSSIGKVLDTMGAFGNREEADKWVSYSKNASNPKFMGALTSQVALGDHKGAVNGILQAFGFGGLDTMGPGGTPMFNPDASQNPMNRKTPITDTSDASSSLGKDGMNVLGTAFAAFNLVTNWDKLNTAQRSMSMAGIALNAYQYGTGENLGQKVLIDSSTPDGPKLTVGNALALAGTGLNVYGMMKNWDQMDVMQRLTYGVGTASQMAALGKRMGFLGNPADGDSSVAGISPQQLGSLGFKAAPSAGVGAIVGPSSAVPQGYTVVGAGNKQGVVVAVPANLANTAATINGTNGITSLNNGDGVAAANVGAYKIYAGWTPTGRGSSNGLVGGTQFFSGLNSSGVTKDPYVLGSMVAASNHGNTIPMRGAPPQDAASAIARSGVSAQSQERPPVNIQQIRKEDSSVNAMIGTSQAIVNSMAKAGNLDAKEGAPYVNAVAAGKRLYDVMTDKNATDKQKAEAVASATQAGVNVAGKLGSEAAAGAAPGINYAMAAYNASKVLTSDMTPEQKAVALRRTAEDTAAAYYTFGLSSVAQFADQKWFGGKGDKLRTKMDSYDPTKIISDKLLAKGLEATDSAFGGKGKDQMGRDQVRKVGQSVGLIDEKFGVQLADGTYADVGTDGKGGQHEFAYKEKVPQGNDVRTLNSYDVDYTNDLDYTANMMTTALSRLISGGKGKEIDQFAGQLANASIKNIGYGQEMTDDTFAKTQANVRGFFAKSGVKSKEDAYALANQGFADGRFSELDVTAIHQGINMAFDDDGFDTAQQLNAGRWKGLDVAAQVPASPGPNINWAENTDKLMQQPLVIAQPGGSVSPQGMVNSALAAATKPAVAYDFKMEGGNYWGPKTAGLFDMAMKEYKDPWVTEYNKVSNNEGTRGMSKEQIRQANLRRAQ